MKIIMQFYKRIFLLFLCLQPLHIAKASDGIPGSQETILTIAGRFADHVERFSQLEDPPYTPTTGARKWIAELGPKFVGITGSGVAGYYFNEHVSAPILGQFMQLYGHLYDRMVDCGASEALADNPTCENTSYSGTLCNPSIRLGTMIIASLPGAFLLYRYLRSPVEAYTTDLIEGLVLKTVRGYLKLLEIYQSREQRGLVNALLADAKSLVSRRAEFITLSDEQRRELFKEASKSGQVGLMRALLRADFQAEAEILARLPLETDTCSVCLNNFDGSEHSSNPLVVRDCHHTHVFHERCLKSCYSISMACPLCRDRDHPGFRQF